MNCPVCKAPLNDEPIQYKCRQCGFRTWKVIAGNAISEEDMRTLLQTGRTGIIDGFFSKKRNRYFSAALEVRDGRVVFVFPAGEDLPSKTQSAEPATNRIRVEAAQSGAVYVSVAGAVNRQFTVDFGLVPARLAECYGVITGVKLLLHAAARGLRPGLTVSANNREFVEYALREHTPSKSEVRNAIEQMWSSLDKMSPWKVLYEPKKRAALKGGVSVGRFPWGVFPWLHADVSDCNGKVIVGLPDCPAARAQFAASLRTAKFNGRVFLLPAAARPVVFAWLRSVRGERGETKRGSDTAEARPS
ncbi:MAG: topoisomerase C-terminal repeat-containing protein [Firmicutes bacterium]|jgi:hypothetical protein|nr:topoisomerase C-terminal repeat-containing protein [Bacillota bacterium]